MGFVDIQEDQRIKDIEKALGMNHNPEDEIKYLEQELALLDKQIDIKKKECDLAGVEIRQDEASCRSP